MHDPGPSETQDRQHCIDELKSSLTYILNCEITQNKYLGLAVLPVSIVTSCYPLFQDWLGGAQSKVGKWMRTADKDTLTVNDRQKIKTVLSIMNKELK